MQKRSDPTILTLVAPRPSRKAASQVATSVSASGGSGTITR
jgi:hypothetical protein